MFLLAIFLTLVLLFSLVSGSAEKSVITGPMVFTAAGLLVYFALPAISTLEITSPVVLVVAELTLAVVLFSDGFPEAENGRGEQYKKETMFRQLQLPAETAAELGQSVVTDVLDHIGSAKQIDDLSLVCLRRIP